MNSSVNDTVPNVVMASSQTPPSFDDSGADNSLPCVTVVGTQGERVQGWGWEVGAIAINKCDIVLNTSLERGIGYGGHKLRHSNG